MSSYTFTTSDGVRLRVLATGPAPSPAEAPTIALVTGWSMPASLWQPAMERLGARHRVVALDPRGQGESAVPRQGYTLERRAADIAEFLAPYRRVVLVGWSLGALESLEYLRVNGERRLAGVVLVDSSVGEGPPPPKSTFPESLRADRRAALDSFVRAIFRTPRSPAEIDALVAGAMRMPLEASLDLLAYPVPREHWRDIARGVKAPLAYVVTPQFEVQSQALKQHRPATEVTVFRNAGHALFVDDPDAFAALLDAFTARAARR